MITFFKLPATFIADTLLPSLLLSHLSLFRVKKYIFLISLIRFPNGSVRLIIEPKITEATVFNCNTDSLWFDTLFSNYSFNFRILRSTFTLKLCPVTCSTAGRIIFSFSKCSENIFFPENVILLFGHKRRDDLSKKKKQQTNTKKTKPRNPGNMMFSSNVLKTWSFQKILTCTWSFLQYLERWYFFFPEQKMKEDDDLWKYDIWYYKGDMGIWYFLYICINVTKMMFPFCQKNQR